MERPRTALSAFAMSLLAAATHSQANLKARSAPANFAPLIFASTASGSSSPLYRMHKQLESCKYTGADLCRIRAERGVGRPPRAA